MFSNMEVFYFNPIVINWEIASKFDQEFNKTFSSIFSNMCTCTICDIIKLYKISHSLKTIPNIFNLYNIPTKRFMHYKITNILMPNHTTFEDGCKMFICTTCN